MAHSIKNPGHEFPNEGARKTTSPLRTSHVSPSACLPNIWKRRGQQAIEYAIVIAALSAALMTMFTYAKRGLQAHIREVTIQEIGVQSDSAPLADVNSNTTSTGVTDTLSSGASASQRAIDGGTQSSYESASTSAGVSVTEQVSL
jgi:hypothetical protein